MAGEGTRLKIRWKTRRLRLAALALAAYALAGCAGGAASTFQTVSATAAPAATPAVSDAAQSAQADSPSGMTLREKVGQLFIVRPDALDPDQTQSRIDDADAAGVTALTDAMRQTLAVYPVGGVVLFGKNIESPAQLTAFTSDLQTAGKRPLFIAVDEEGGAVARLANNPAFSLPQYASAAAVGADGPAAAREMGRTIGGYLQGYGFNLDFAPVADVDSNPANPVIGARAFSDDPETAAACVSAAVQGFAETGVLCCLKHFPGHGDTAGDSHDGAVTTDKTLDALRSCELKPFAAGVEVGAPLVMVGHIAAPNAVPAEEADLPASLSPSLITGLLRQELGFQGLVVTDSLAMGAITETYPPGEAAVRALQAGADLLLMPAGLAEAFDAVVEAVETGAIPEEALDAKVARILAAKQALAATG